MGALVGIALVWFIIEMLIWYLIAQLAYGAGWWVFMWFVVAAVIGIGMIKKTVQTLNPMAQSMKSGVIPNPATTPGENTITKSIATGVAGLLLLLRVFCRMWWRCFCCCHLCSENSPTPPKHTP